MKRRCAGYQTGALDVLSGAAEKLHARDLCSAFRRNRPSLGAMRRLNERCLTVVIPAAIAVAAFGLAAFVAFGMSTHADRRTVDGYYADPAVVVAQLVIGALAVTACVGTCCLAVRRVAGRSSSIGSSVCGVTVSVALATMWFFVLLIQGSS